MTLSRPSRALLLLLVGLGAATLVPNARAEGATPPPQASVDCPTASEQGQRLRDDGKYLRARDMFHQCSRDTCPGVVRKDCTKWLAALEDSVPTIVVSARDAGDHDIGEVRVIVDGETVMAKLEGRPLSIDPGEHTMRFETEGNPPVEMRVIIQVGEKNRLVKVQFHPRATPGAIVPAGTTTGTTPGTPATAPETPPPSGSSPPIASYVLAGVGVLALGSFAFFGLTGKSDLSNLKTNCAPYCAQSDLTAAKTKLTVADVSLGVGVVAIGVAAVLYFTGANKESEPAKAAAHLDVRPTPGGAVVGLGAAF